MLDDSGHLPIDQAHKLIAMVEKRPLPESAEHLQQRGERLLAMLRKSIELNKPLAFDSSRLEKLRYDRGARSGLTTSELFQRDPLKLSHLELVEIAAFYRKTLRKETTELAEADRKKTTKARRAGVA
jgi:hypothetical protein